MHCKMGPNLLLGRILSPFDANAVTKHILKNLSFDEIENDQKLKIFLIK